MRVETIGPHTLYLGDWRDMMEDGVFGNVPFDSALITDPPYSSGGYQDAGKGAGSIGSTVKHEIHGDTYSTRGYMRLIKNMGQKFRCAEVYVFTDWRMWTYTFDSIEDSGFRVRSMLVWDKGYGGMGIKWRSQHELICWGARGTLPPGWGIGNVLQVPRSGNANHPTEKPVELMTELIRASGRPLIIDPFMGSGSTGCAAARVGRSFIGVEIEPRHFDTACRRVEAATRQADLFIAPPETPRAVQEAML